MKNLLILSKSIKLDVLKSMIKVIKFNKFIIIEDEISDKNNEIFDYFFKKKIPFETKKLGENYWINSFKLMHEISNQNKEAQIFLSSFFNDFNVRSAMINASYLNNFRIFSKENDELIMLPFFKFSYLYFVTDKKREILNLLYNAKDYQLGLDKIHELTKMSFPLISYHINGNLKSEGLKELALVTSKEVNGRSYIILSNLGKLLIEGYIS